MLDSLLQQTTIPMLEQVTIYGQKRHAVLAGNIANIDTPDYRTRDLPVQDFEQALQKAVQARRETFHANRPVVPRPDSGSLHPPGPASAPLPSPGEGLVSGWQQTTGPSPTNIAELFPPSLHTARESAPRNVIFQDGGNRSIELESMEMAKNTSMQSFAIEVMMSQIRMLESVISERVT